MTTIRLDAATLEKFRAADGRVVLCDESGTPVRVCILPPTPEGEPNLAAEEWDRRIREPGGMTTAEVLNYLKNLGRS